MARFLKAQGKLKGTRVVATSMSNLGLERVLARDGISLARTNVGDRYVLEEMLNSGNVLGGEQSGHIIFLEDSPAGDGLLTAVKIASLVSMHGQLESLVQGLKDYPQTIVNVKVKSKPPLESLPEVAKALAEAQIRARRKRPHRVALFGHRAAGARDGGSRARCGRPAFQSIGGECVALFDRRLIRRNRIESAMPNSRRTSAPCR